MNKRINKLLDSVATKEDKKIIIFYQGKRYTLKEYANIIIPHYVIISGQELLLETEDGYIRLEEFFDELIQNYKEKNPTEASSNTNKRTINDKFTELVHTHPKLTNIIYDANYMLKVLKESDNPTIIWYNMQQAFREDENFMLEAIKINPNIYCYADIKLKRSREFALKCVQIDGMLLEKMEGTYNVDISYEPYIDSLGNIFNTAEYKYTHKNDCEVVFTAVLQNLESIKFAKFDNFKINNKNLGKKSQEYTNKVKMIITYAITNNPELYKYVPEQLKNDEDIINVYNAWKPKTKIR